jgi:antitoxin YefM
MRQSSSLRGSSVWLWSPPPWSRSAAGHVPLAEVKNHLSEVVDRLEREHGRVVITTHGRSAAVMLSLEETLAILSDPELMAAIGEAEVAAGGTRRLSEQEALAELER